MLILMYFLQFGFFLYLLAIPSSTVRAMNLCVGTAWVPLPATMMVGVSVSLMQLGVAQRT